jgi:outer membrane protein assembly factor BamB
MRFNLASATAACALYLTAGVVLGGDWPLYAHDHHNSNFAPTGGAITAANAGYLRRPWETFNDDALVPESPPSGFVLEEALGLTFPASVVGVIGSPIVRDGTIYWVDALGTVFARDAQTGLAHDPWAHWTTTLVDPDYAAGDPPLAPELYYTAPVVTDDYVWLIGSVYGRVHLLERAGGAEIDFDPSTPQIDPFALVPDRPVASVLGDPVIAVTGDRTLLVASVNVIVNDAVFGEGETGLVVAYDITVPADPVEAWRTPTIDLDPATGMPFGTGVSAGSGLALDLERGYVIGGTGQNTSEPYPGYPDPAQAPEGYVDRSDSIFAIDLETGAFVWTNQLHQGDVFDLNNPVSTGPNRPDGPRDADVLAPPVLFSARIHGRQRDLVGAGSKGGLFRVVDRDTGETVWERQISKPTGIGGIQGGAAFADGVIYVAGFEGIDDGFSDAQFGISLETGLYPNAFFATFSPAFWTDVEDVSDDGDAATGMRVKVYALDASSGRSLWHLPRGDDYVELLAGASLRHVTATEDLLFVTTSSGQIFVLDSGDGTVLLADRTPDLNDVFDLGLGKPHHASMNGGTVVADGMVFVPLGAQNNPSGGVYAYRVNQRPLAANDVAIVSADAAVDIDVLANDADPDGDRLRFARVAGREIDATDGAPDKIVLPFGTVVVFNPGDDAADPEAAYLRLIPSAGFRGRRLIRYSIEDVAPDRVLNGIVLDEPDPTHIPRRDSARISIRAGG